MAGIWKKLFLLALCQIVVKTTDESAKARDFGGVLGGNNQDYQIIQYPPNYYPTNNDFSDHFDSPLQSLFGRGLNLFMLKIGIMGLIKGVIVLFLLGFLIKLPLVLLKVAVLKSFFLPFLVAPLLYQLYMNNSNQSETTTMSNPGENGSKPTVEGVSGGARNIDEDPFSAAWKSVKMFAENEQCMERIYCILGASNNDSFTGKIFSRVLKFVEHTSPPMLKDRMSLIAKAFSRGQNTATCSYKCETPEVLIHQGLRKVKIF